MAKKKAAAAKAPKPDKQKIDVQAATLVGDIRDQILDIFKQHGEWKKLKEQPQKDIAAMAENVAKGVVRETASIIAGRGFKAIHGIIKKVATEDNGIKINIVASRQADGRHELGDAQGDGVTIVLKDISAFIGQRSEPEIDEDEPSLDLEEKGE